MPSDPKWEQKTKADPLTLENLIAWLGTMPPDKPYNYNSNDKCLLGQYFTAHGYKNALAGSRDVDHGDGWQFTTVFPRAFGDIARDGERTFGAALARARALSR